MQMSGKNNFPGRLFIVGVEGGVSKAHLSQRSRRLMMKPLWRSDPKQLSESCMEAIEFRAKTRRVPMNEKHKQN
jgi:hypothetical protein